MTRTFRSFQISDFDTIKKQTLHWANQFSVCCFLDNNQYAIPPHSKECLVGIGDAASYGLQTGACLEGLEAFLQEKDDWYFGHLGYDLKQETGGESSPLPGRVGFPDLYFFIPETVVILAPGFMQIGTIHQDPVHVYEQIFHMQTGKAPENTVLPEIRQRLNREDYLDTLARLKDHIRRGDCYEINFCQEFFVEDAVIEPLTVYERLTRVSPNPFSAFYKLENCYLLCASPERYLKKTGSRIISQPIKGTAPRDMSDPVRDKAFREALLASAKERAENVMVVDLVRNDLSRVCREGTVAVDELFGMYSYPQVHQMISTVSGELREGTGFTDIIRATFPMGSMTGAPKKKVMELIDRYERSRRGLFSGAVGYLDPAGDADFNVVIRSILYDKVARYLSFPAGSAVTHYSDPAQEYAECALKGDAIRRVLSGDV
ncbi:MAG: anthranilate synthase component I family protein [Chitinophagaceae bacterium]|jgi:para-aminobenzoate synthetase component 1|nr:anthranilate synthase component I family protein [Chitinophagaceae bacterium]